MRLSLSCVIMAALLGARPAFAQGICNQLAGPPTGVRGASGVTLPARTRSVFDVCFDGDTWRVQPPPNTRITSRDPVWIRIRHFNFLRYQLHVDVQETRAESYAYLTRLWSSILSPNVFDLFSGLGALGDVEPALAPDPFMEAARRVYASAQDVRRRIEAALLPYTRPGLTGEEAARLAAATAGVRDAVETLRAAHNTLEAMVETDTAVFTKAFGASKAYYKLAADTYDEAIGRSDSFLSLADRTIGDEVRRLGTRDAGTRVTVVLMATDPSGATSDVETIHYVSQSTMPLVAHGGAAFSGISGVTFEKVKRAAQFSEEDFFARKGDDGGTPGFATFLAWQLLAGAGSLDADTKQQPVGLLLSVGTDLTAPGRRLYVGPSVMLFGRLVVTAGGAFGRASEGEDPIEPDVFRLVREHGDTSWFTAVTVRIY